MICSQTDFAAMLRTYNLVALSGPSGDVHSYDAVRAGRRTPACRSPPLLVRWSPAFPTSRSASTLCRTARLQTRRRLRSPSWWARISRTCFRSSRRLASRRSTTKMSRSLLLLRPAVRFCDLWTSSKTTACTWWYQRGWNRQYATRRVKRAIDMTNCRAREGGDTRGKSLRPPSLRRDKNVLSLAPSVFADPRPALLRAGSKPGEIPPAEHGVRGVQAHCRGARGRPPSQLGPVCQAPVRECLRPGRQLRRPAGGRRGGRDRRQRLLRFCGGGKGGVSSS